jgi:hypothetical protein
MFRIFTKSKLILSLFFYNSPNSRSRKITLLRLLFSYYAISDKKTLKKIIFFLIILIVLNKPNSQKVTGGMFKIKARIHRGILIHDY